MDADLKSTCETLAKRTLPRWNELPDLELYMDQVTSLVGRYLKDDRELTASMVNNYVKHKIMPAPVRKKYTREHLAYLIVICTLKPVLPISTIRQMMDDELAEQELPLFYDGFCDLFEESCRETAARHLKSESLSQAGMLCRAALCAKAEQSLALQMAAAQPEEEAESESTVENFR